MKRRDFLKISAGTGLLALAPGWMHSAKGATPDLLELHRIISSPVKIESIELLKRDGHFFVRTLSTDGAVGMALADDRMESFHPILLRRIIPFFQSKDARDLERLVDEVYGHGSNHSVAGLPFWSCVAYVEFSLFDLLGKIAGRPVGDLLGGVRRREIPVYFSSLRSDTTPEQEIAWLSRRLAETNSKAVKFKISGRLSRDAADPKRTERIVKLARETWGNKIALHADACGSCDLAEAIETGKLLQAHEVYFFEEPCPFENFTDTKKVADALDILIAGGEHDWHYEKFQWYTAHRGLDIVQPGLNSNGGFIRTLRVAQLAAAAGMDISPHAPHSGFHAGYLMQFASAVPNLGRFQEFSAEPQKPERWFSPWIQARDSLVKVPPGPGLGLSIDPDYLKKARRIQ